MTLFPEKLLPDALCLDADPDVFFPSVGENATAAKALCARCPITEQCREWAIVNLGDEAADVGIWGGSSPRDRAAERMRRGMRSSGRRHSDVLAPCGTDAAYRRHWRRGEKPCRPCTTAHTEAATRRLAEDQRRQKAQRQRERRRSAA